MAIAKIQPRERMVLIVGAVAGITHCGARTFPDRKRQLPGEAAGEARLQGGVLVFMIGRPAEQTRRDGQPRPCSRLEREGASVRAGRILRVGQGWIVGCGARSERPAQQCVEFRWLETIALAGRKPRSVVHDWMQVRRCAAKIRKMQQCLPLLCSSFTTTF